MSNVFQVSSFGAVGDGSTDDTAAIRATISAASTAGGGVVQFGAGTFIVRDLDYATRAGDDLKVCLDVLSHVHLRGAGVGATIIKQAASSSVGAWAHVINFGRRVSLLNGAAEDLAPVHDASVSDLTVDGNEGNLHAGRTNNTINISTGCTDITVRNLRALNSAGYGIAAQRDEFKNILIENIEVENSRADGIDAKMDEADQVKNCILRNIYVKNFNTASALQQAAIDIRRGWQLDGFYVDGIENGAEDVGVRIQGGDLRSGGPGEPHNNTAVRSGVVKVASALSRTGVQVQVENTHLESITVIGANSNFRIRANKTSGRKLVALNGGRGLDLTNNNDGPDIEDCHFDSAHVAGQSNGQSLSLAGALCNTFTACTFEDGMTTDAASDRNTFIQCKFSGAISDAGQNSYLLCEGGSHDQNIVVPATRPFRLSRSGASAQYLETTLNPSGAALNAVSWDNSNGPGNGKPFSLNVGTPNGTDAVNFNLRVQGANKAQMFNNKLSLSVPIDIASYSVSNQPSASGTGQGSLIYVTNGDAGEPCLAVSDGSNWRRIALGATVNAST
jgi:hypothetical protein